MEISRTTRIHLVYQFIIITLLVLSIGYSEFLLDNKFLLILGLVTIFFYQWTTLSCYTELSFAQRRNLIEILLGTPYSATENEIKKPLETQIAESKEAKESTVKKFHETNMKNIAESTRTSNNENCTPKQRIYKLRNSQSNGFYTFNNTSSAFNSNDKNRLQDSELTKVYFFPHRQKRLEQWIDSDRNGRPYKISRVPNMEANTEFSNKTNSNNPVIETTPELLAVAHVEESKVKKSLGLPFRQKKIEPREEPVKSTEVSSTSNFPSNMSNRSSNIEQSLEMDNKLTLNVPPIDTTRELVEDPNANESRIRKSYTFPFRQKRIEQCEDSVEGETMNTPSMPCWQSVNYSVAAKQKSRRRRSVTICNLKNQQLDLVNNNDHRDFSQSLEISDTSFSLHSDLKESSFKSPNANFSKLKLMILNCIAKMKKDNPRTNSDMKGTDPKALLFEACFQSRENLQSMEYEDGIPLKLGGKMVKNSHGYTEYVPFQKRGFVC